MNLVIGVIFWVVISLLIVGIILNFLIKTFQLLDIFDWLYFQYLKIRSNSDKKPDFDFNQLTPWQAQFFLHGQQSDVEDMIMSYVFWLAYNKLVKIQIHNKEIYVQYLTNQDTNLINLYIDSVIRKHVKLSDAVKELKLFGRSYLISSVKSSLQPLYKYNFSNVSEITGNIIIWGSFLFFMMIIFINMVDKVISKDTATFISSLSLTIYIFSLIVIYFEPLILNVASKLLFLKPKGKQIKKELLAYYYYLYRAEKNKLNHASSLVDMPPIYLKHLSYSIAFGLVKNLSDYGDGY